MESPRFADGWKRLGVILHPSSIFRSMRLKERSIRSRSRMDAMRDRDTLWDRAVWRSSRMQAYQCLLILLKQIRECKSDFAKVVEQSRSIPALKHLRFSSIDRSETKTENKRIVIVVDDTMHLRSMRKSIMRLCKMCRSSPTDQSDTL